MRNIRTFETYEDFLASQEVVSGSGQYVEDIVPGYVYIRDRYLAGESGYTFFNKNNSSGETGGTEYIFGDIIYHDGTEQLKSVYWSGWTDTLGTPIGFVVVPTDMAPDGNARMIALTDIESTEPGPREAVGGSSPGNQQSYQFDGSNLDGDLNWYDGYAVNDISQDPIVYACASAAYPGAMSTDVPGVAGNPIADGEYYTSNEKAPVVSPYMRDSDSINPNYLQENWEVEPPTPPMLAQLPKNEKAETLLGSPNTNYAYNALSDFSGLTWTRLLADSQEAAYGAAQDFSTNGTNPGDWYVPSLGEAGFIQARFMAIASILYQLFNESENYNAYLGANGCYFTSTLAYDGDTIYGAPYAYCVTQQIQQGPMMAINPTRELTMGTSYPSDIPSPFASDLDLGLTFYDGSSLYVRPMAMIKEGRIVTETGTPVANGHQISDIQNGGVGEIA